MTKFDIHKAANELEDELQLKVANFTSHMSDEIDWRDDRISKLEDDLDDATREIDVLKDQVERLEGREYRALKVDHKIDQLKEASLRPAWERDKDIQ
jgi:peptidoglycan hydrolase CwlO-like protein